MKEARGLVPALPKNNQTTTKTPSKYIPNSGEGVGGDLLDEKNTLWKVFDL
jgi:hypothetical protein